MRHDINCLRKQNEGFGFINSLACNVGLEYKIVGIGIFPEHRTLDGVKDVREN